MNLLAQLLNQSPKSLAARLAEFETLCAQPSLDVRLRTEIEDRTRVKMAELILDPQDTTAEELHRALQARTSQVDTELQTSLGIDPDTSLAAAAPRLVEAFKKLPLARTVWAIKPSVLKELLHAVPPKVVMKHLHYRSIDSLLKNEKPGELYAVARLSEPGRWYQRFVKALGQLEPTDFETAKLKIIELKAERWAGLLATQATGPVISFPETGSLALLPLPVAYLPGGALGLLLLMSEAAGEVKNRSSYCKLMQVRPDFGRHLGKYLQAEAKDLMIAEAVSWRALRQHYASRTGGLPSVFESFLQADDLAAERPEALLSKLAPSAGWWQETYLIGVPVGEDVVSMNLTDQSLDLANQALLKKRSLYYLQRELADELAKRYLGQPAFENFVLEALEKQLTAKSKARTLTYRMQKVA